MFLKTLTESGRIFFKLQEKKSQNYYGSFAQDHVSLLPKNTQILFLFCFFLKPKPDSS